MIVTLSYENTQIYDNNVIIYDDNVDSRIKAVSAVCEEIDVIPLLGDEI
jgi:hypothetical protein